MVTLAKIEKEDARDRRGGGTVVEIDIEKVPSI